MKKIATNTLATLVLIGMLSLTAVHVSAIGSKGSMENKQELRRLERVYQRHDRKHELRASVLGISPEELRDQLKKRPLDAVIKKHGFKNKASFYTAVTGKLKDELRRRGWSERKIEEFAQKRLARMADGLPKTLAFNV